MNIKDFQRYFCFVKFLGLIGEVSFDYLGDFVLLLYEIVYFQVINILNLEKLIIGLWLKSCKLRFYLNFSKVKWNFMINGFFLKLFCYEDCFVGISWLMIIFCCWKCFRCLDGVISV